MYEDVSFRIYVTCYDCGDDLTFDIEQRDGEVTTKPRPCPVCIKVEKEESYKEGFNAGQDEGMYNGRAGG
jgi:hypothetical protein